MDANPIKVLIAWLRAQPEVTMPVSSSRKGFEAGEPLIVVDVGSGFRVIRDVEDRWEMAVHYYGPTKDEAFDLAIAIRIILLERLPASRVGAVVVNDVGERHAPFNDTDPLTGEERYLHGISIYLT